MNSETPNIIIEAINAAVRPMVTLMLTGGLLWGFVAGKIGGETYIGIVAVVIGFWFRERQDKQDIKEKKAILQDQKELVREIRKP